MIHRTPFLLPLFYPTLTWRIQTPRKELFLTFDDGPVPGPTEFVLDTLSRFQAQATFFCIGDNVRKYPGVFSSILANGHAVGNHTFNHLNGWKSTTEEYVDNCDLCSNEFSKNSPAFQPASTALFRPPYGRITRSQIRALKNFEIVMWDVLSIDYSRRILPEKCLKNTIQATRNGSIIVFHDSYKAERNLTYVLPRFIRHFVSQGYSFKALR